jgi:mono/diheme cytochrome c family protein
VSRASLFVVASSTLALVASLASAACDQTPKRRAPTKEEEPDVPKTAAQIYADRCAGCHGKEGKGDGPTASTLNPRPRSFADPAWQASVTDETLRKVIVSGGPSIGKSPLMPASPELAKQTSNADAASVVDGLVSVVRGFSPALRKP